MFFRISRARCEAAEAKGELIDAHITDAGQTGTIPHFLVMLIVLAACSNGAVYSNIVNAL
jgi:hypothetical protein